MTEREIIKYCKERHPKGQKALVYQYSEVLMGLAYRYTASYDTAKDLVQDTFIRVFEKIDVYDAERGDFSSWLKSIAIHIILMHLRKEKRLFENQQKYANHIQRHLHHELIDTDMETKELHRILLQLPDRQRVVFNLYAIEGYSHKEIATRLDITESYSRTIATRARKVLQQLLKEGDFHKANTYGKS